MTIAHRMGKAGGWFFMMALGLGAGLCFAAEGQGRPAVKAVKVEAAQQVSYVFKTGVQSQAGNFSIGRAATRVTYVYTFKNGLSLESALIFDHYDMRDRTAVGLPSSLESKGFSLGTKVPMPFCRSGRLFLGVDAGPYIQTASRHDFSSDALRMKSRLYGIYRGTKGMVLAAGVMIQAGYERQAVMPFIGLRYALNERWAINALSREPSLEYKISDKTLVKWQIGGVGDEFEVRSGSRKGNVVRIAEMHAGMGLEHALTKVARFQIFAGWAFNKVGS